MMITQHLSKKEYQCPCCGGYPCDFDLNDLLVIYDVLFSAFENIREEYGKPIPVMSGFRCNSYNSIVGGEPISAHQFGCALDMDLPDADEVYKLEDIIERLYPELRRGTYVRKGTFIHIDDAYLIHPRGSSHWRQYARWEG